MASYWLLKTEPAVWGWQDQALNGGVSQWDGVRNAQAQKHLRSMQEGDFCFFYHTGKSPAIVGLVQVVKGFYSDPSDATGKCGMVDVRELHLLPKPVPLALLKTEDGMADFVLLKQPRLSVLPVSNPVWNRICELGELSLPPSSSNNKCPPSVEAHKMPKKGTSKKEKRQPPQRQARGVTSQANAKQDDLRHPLPLEACDLGELPAKTNQPRLAKKRASTQGHGPPLEIVKRRQSARIMGKAK